MIETVELTRGYAISRLIRGGWQQHASADFDVVDEAERLHAFVGAGVGAFETADTYRNLDAALARMLAERHALGLTLPRIHTRITLPAHIDESLAHARARLGMERLDLVQLQSWRLGEAKLIDAALRLEQARGFGLLLHHGLMNVDADIVERLRGAGARPLTVQAQCSLLDRRALVTLAPYARANRMHMLAYGPLAGGFLSSRWLGRPDPGMTPSADAPFHIEYRIVIDLFGGWPLLQRLLSMLDRIASAHGVELSSVALRWVLDQPGVAAVLAGASSPARLAGWREVCALALTDEDRAAIDEVLADARGPSGPVGALERDAAGPFARAIAASAKTHWRH